MIEEKDLTDLTPTHRGYAVHFLCLLTDEEKDSVPNSLDRVPTLYRMALNKASDVGGRKYHNQSFGGGVEFIGSRSDVLRDINKMMKG